MTKALHGVYLAWTKKFIALNSWRIEGEFEDCLQEAQIKFVQCQTKYGDVEAPHLMSLFQRALVRHFHTLSSKRSKFLSTRREYQQEMLPAGRLAGEHLIGEFVGICSSIPTELLEISSLLRFINRMEILLMNIRKEIADACSYSGDDLKELLEIAMADGKKGMPDEQFDKLSEDAKNWLDKAVDAANAGQDLPPLNGGEAMSDNTETKPAKKNGNGRGRRSNLKPNAVIMTTVEKNPRRRGSKAADQFALYKDEMTVEEFLHLGGKRAFLRVDLKSGYITVKNLA